MRIILFLLLISISASASAQASVKARATVTVLKSLGITKETDMNFAEINVKESDGSLILSPNSSARVSGGVTFSTQGLGQAAKLTIVGDESIYSISLPEEILFNDGKSSLKINNFTHTGTGSLAKGAETVSIGATLHVNRKQEPGTFRPDKDMMRVIVQYK